MLNSSFLSIILSIGTILFLSNFNNISAENENSLVGCVNHYMSLYENAMINATKEQRQNITQDPFMNPQSIKMVTTQACMLAYQHTGTYVNLLPQEQQREYFELAPMTIILGSLGQGMDLENQN